MFWRLHEPAHTTAVTAGRLLWVINWHAQGEDISSAPARESGRYRGLTLPRPCRGPRHAADWRGWPNVRLPIPIAAFRAHGRLGQLSARSGLYVEGQRPSRRAQDAGRLVPQTAPGRAL